MKEFFGDIFHMSWKDLQEPYHKGGRLLQLYSLIIFAYAVLFAITKVFAIGDQLGLSIVVGLVILLSISALVYFLLSLGMIRGQLWAIILTGILGVLSVITSAVSMTPAIVLLISTGLVLFDKFMEED